MHVELKNLPEQRVAAVHHVGPYEQISEAFSRLDEIASNAHLIRPGRQKLAVYHDDPTSTPAQRLRSEAALTVPDDAPLPSTVTELRIPAGRYASATHVGPYDGLGHAWAELKKSVLPQTGHRPAPGPTFEIYRNTPENAPPEELRTELYVPVV